MYPRCGRTARPRASYLLPDSTPKGAYYSLTIKKGAEKVITTLSRTDK